MTSYWKDLAHRLSTIVKLYWRGILKWTLIIVSIGAGLIGELFAVTFVVVWLFGQAWFGMILAFVLSLVLICVEWALFHDYQEWKERTHRAQVPIC